MIATAAGLRRQRCACLAVGVLVACGAFFGTPLPVEAAQTLGDCEALVASGAWAAAAQACGAVLSALLGAQESSVAENCENHDTCGSSRSTYLPTVQTQLDLRMGYSRAAFAEGLALAHLGKLSMAQYWLRQAVNASAPFARYTGESELIQSYVPTAKALHTAEQSALDRVTRQLPKPAPVSPSPAPTSPPAVGCTRDVVVTKTVQPLYPVEAQQERVGPVAVEVQLDLDGSGAVVDATVYRSSSNLAIDNAALSAAKASTYAPKLVNCRPVPARVIFTYQFTPDT